MASTIFCPFCGNKINYAALQKDRPMLKCNACQKTFHNPLFVGEEEKKPVKKTEAPTPPHIEPETKPKKDSDVAFWHFVYKALVIFCVIGGIITGVRSCIDYFSDKSAPEPASQLVEIADGSGDLTEGKPLPAYSVYGEKFTMNNHRVELSVKLDERITEGEINAISQVLINERNCEFVRIEYFLSKGGTLYANTIYNKSTGQNETTMCQPTQSQMDIAEASQTQGKILGRWTMRGSTGLILTLVEADGKFIMDFGDGSKRELKKSKYRGQTSYYDANMDAHYVIRPGALWLGNADDFAPVYDEIK